MTAKLICHDLIRSAGLPSLDDNFVSITGCDPILPSQFLIGEAGAAALAAVGHAASELWRLKTGRRQTITISVRDAAIAQRSHEYLRVIDGRQEDLWSPFSGFYATKDHRWLQFHCNFPHHQQGILTYFNCPADKALLEMAVKTQLAAEIEENTNWLGLCTAMVRSQEEWRNHPQSVALERLPLLEIQQIAHSPPQPLPEGESPLSGIRVLDLTRVLAGPVCGKLLAGLGATVLRIASPKLPFIQPLVMDTGFGKLSAYLDLDEAKDKAQLGRLIQKADVFVQSYRPGGLSSRGFSAVALAEQKPGIIYVELSAYSHLGPWANRHGYDSLVQSATGIADEQGSWAKPQHLPAQSLDYITGYLAAMGVMEALRRRALEGGSYHVRLSLAQTAQWFTGLGRSNENFRACSKPERADLGDLLIKTPSPFGLLEHVKPVLHLSETPIKIGTGSVPLGTHQAIWP